jgi:hypothetical protein
LVVGLSRVAGLQCHQAALAARAEQRHERGDGKSRNHPVTSGLIIPGQREQAKVYQSVEIYPRGIFQPRQAQGKALRSSKNSDSRRYFDIASVR